MPKALVISDEKRANIRKLYAEGMPIHQIRKRLKIHDTVLAKIVDGIPDPHNGKAQQLFAGLHNNHRYNRFKRVDSVSIED